MIPKYSTIPANAMAHCAAFNKHKVARKGTGRLIPIYNHLFVHRDFRSSIPISNMWREQRLPRWIKKSATYQYHATVQDRLTGGTFTVTVSSACCYTTSEILMVLPLMDSESIVYVCLSVLVWANKRKAVYVNATQQKITQNYPVPMLTYLLCSITI